MQIPVFSTETSWFLIISFLNACIASILCLNGFPDHLIFWSIQSALFAFTASIAHFTFLFSIISFPFWILGRFNHDQRLSNALILCSNIILLLIIYVDARVFELYKFHLNSMALELIKAGALQDILAFNYAMWGVFTFIVSILIISEVIIGIYLLKKLKHSSYKTALSYLIIAIFFTCASVSQTIYIFSDAKADTTITGLKRYIPWPQTITAKGRLRDWGLDVKESNTKRLGSVSKELNYPKQPLQCSPEKNYNLLFVIVDALRHDMLNEEIMPFSSKLAQSSHHFTEHYSLSNSTRFGLFSLMYGLTGNYWDSILQAKKESVLMTALIEKQYQLNITSSASLSPEFKQSLFSNVSDQTKEAPSKEPSYKKDKFVTEDLIHFLENRDPNKPFFSFILLDSPRAYSYPNKFKEKFKPSWEKINYLELDENFDSGKFINRYKNSAHYVDSLLGDVYETLKKKSLLENTVIVFTSLHGQEFNETGKNFWGHNSNFSKFQTQVPLFITWPEHHPLFSQQQFNQQTASIDIVPTIMGNMFSCSNPVSDYSLGYDLYASQNNYARPLLFESWSQRAIMGTNYIMLSYDEGGNEYFDRNYQTLENFTAPQQDLSEVFKQMSAFNK